MDRQQPYSARVLEERLAGPLAAVLSPRRTAAEPARALARRSRAEQDFALHWLGVIVRTNAELGYQFAASVAHAFERMDLAAVEGWIIQAMDVYDRQGLYPGSAALADVDGYAAGAARRELAATLASSRSVLETYLRGLSGRGLRIEQGSPAWTDTETVYLPERIDRFASRADNFRLYKATCTHLWAQTWFGTFRRPSPQAPFLSERLAAFADPDAALRLFAVLEGRRLDACIARTLPGVGRDLEALGAGAVPAAGRWAAAWRDLARADAGVDDSLTWVGRLIGCGVAPPPALHQGALRLDAAEAAICVRLERERAALGALLSRLADEIGATPPADGDQAADRRRFRLEADEGGSREAGERALTLDGRPLTPPADVARRLASLLQDLDQVPDDYLVAAGDGDDGSMAGPRPTADLEADAGRGERVFVYDEWDYRRRHYRKNWCMLREIDMEPLDEPFVERTLERYKGVVADLRRTFEALRGEDRLLRRQPEGDDVDIDAVVDAITDMKIGREVPNRLFTKLRKLERDIAAVFMVDVSGSTKGWINDAERESLVLLCEALEILGDRYAIYGFSGMTRKRCELYRIKRLDEPYSDLVKARIAGIRPREYTRMGVTIRHLTAMLASVAARTRLLVTLSDGKPDDYDGYRGEYGIEDTRQALFEARHAGIHPFCVTIDRQARDYLPHMYGAVNYVVVDEVRRLPSKVSEIYRHLTA